jgi:hypothetical protein
MTRTGGRRRAALGAGLAALLVSFTAPAAAAVSHPAKPTVTSVRLSKSSLSSSGGTITVTASVRHATTCTFASTPRLHGLPAKLKCSSGKATEKVRLPANAGDAALSYKLSVSATGPGGTSARRYATARVLPPAPTETLNVSPDGLLPSGGKTTLTYALKRSESCVLSSSPAVDGLPVTQKCITGKTAVTFTSTFSLPALSGSVAQPYRFTLKVSGPGGTTSSAVTETVWPAMTFGKPAAADPPEGYAGSLSCASASDCVATDFFGNAIRWNGTSWSAPQRIFQLPAGVTTPMQTAVSCPTTSLCVAVAESGATALYNGATWSSGTSSGIAATAVSCASANLCAAAGGDDVAVYNGSSWSEPTLLSSGSDTIESVSCARGASFCMATDYDGNGYSYDGASWSPATAFDTSTDPAPVVSCASQDFCVAVDGSALDDAGDAYTYNGSSWSGPVTVDSSMGLSSISCPSSTYCLATAENGLSYYALSSGAWSVAQSGIIAYSASCWAAAACGTLSSNGDFNILTDGTWGFFATSLQTEGFTTAVSCPTASFCAAADQTGSVAVYNGSRWSVQSPPITPSDIGLVSISCTSPKFCMAADDQAGEYGSAAYTWNGSYWSGSLPGLYLTSVSCTSSAFCMALGYLSTGVFAATWNGTSWSSQTKIDSSENVGQVSCSSPDFCAAVDANGNAMTYNGTTWSSPDPIDHGVTEPLATVSCPTASFCTAMDGYGQAFTYTPSSGWSGAVGVESDAGVTSVSCVSAAFCVAVDLTGNVVTEYNGTWSAPVNIDPQTDSNFYGFEGVSCATVAFCAAVDFEGNASLGTG